MNEHKKKRWYLIEGLVLVVLILSLFLPLLGSLWTLDRGSWADNRAVKELGLSDVAACLEAEYDSHGGFHGDGISMEVYGLDQDAAVGQMQTLPGWHEGALDQAAATLAYGSGMQERQQGPYITDMDSRTLAPQKDWAYWYFEDRQAENTDERYSTDVLDRPSLNFTLALYESSGRLYVFKMDT